MFIPVRILISFVIAFVIAGIFYMGWKEVNKNMAENDIKKQLNELIAKLEVMYANGDARKIYNPHDISGEKREIILKLPTSIEYVAFGVDPDTDEKLTADGACIFYKIKGRSKHSIWLNEIKFRKGKNKNVNGRIEMLNEGIVLKSSGKYKITCELIEDIYGEKYILIY